MVHVGHDPVERVNEKHADDLLAAAQSLGGHPEATAARAERIDSEGIHLVLTTPDGLVQSHLGFAEAVSDPKRMRAAFKDLTRRAHAARAVGHDSGGA